MSLNNGVPTPSARRTVSVALLAVVVLVVAGGAVAVTAAWFELRNSSGSGPGQVKLTDDLGRTETVPANPTRVVALSPSIVDSMVRLGLRSTLVGVDCGSSSASGLAQDYDANQTAAWGLTPSMCVTVYPLNVEELLNLTPQLILASTIISLSDVEEVQATYHLPVVMLQPSSIDGVVRDVSTLGEIFPSASASVSQLTSKLEVQVGAVNSFDQNLSYNDSTLPTVLLTYDVNPVGSTSPGYWSFGPGTFGQSLLELAGGSSVSANVTLPWPELSGGQVLVANPSVIIFGTGFTLGYSQYAAGPDWGSLSAVQQGAIHGIDSTLITEPDPTMVLVGLPTLIHILYPSTTLG